MADGIESVARHRELPKRDPSAFSEPPPGSNAVERFV
jgi:hypothetical protein